MVVMCSNYNSTAGSGQTQVSNVCCGITFSGHTNIVCMIYIYSIHTMLVKIIN